MQPSASSLTPTVPSVSVVIITYRRPQPLDGCLRSLEDQTVLPDQVVVVDASPDDESRQVVAQHPLAVYVYNAGGAGNMTNSRNAGLAHAEGDVVAFLDDDVEADPTYISVLKTAYSDPGLSCSCALTINPGAMSVSAASNLGRMDDDGMIHGEFDVDPGGDIPIDHGIGASMTFRRSLIEALGGRFREDYRGTSLREDTDMFFRAKAMGEQPRFLHQAVVRHYGAAHAVGKRFDLRYHYWGSRNHAVLLINNFGITPMLSRSLIRMVRDDIQGSERQPLSRVVRAATTIIGTLTGVAFCLVRQGGQRLPPQRVLAYSLAPHWSR